jgi:hypothetical protein
MAKHRRNRTAAVVEECYMCDSPGKTDEHVPPKCFFQPKDRQGLARVPSCAKHNLDNAPDVEEIKNNITLFDGINDYGTTIAKTKTLASFLRRPKLFWRMFRGAREATVEGREVILNNVDMTKFKTVMEAIAYALYYQDNGNRFGYGWHVYGTGLRTNAELQGDLRNVRYREMLARLEAVPMETIHPHAFRYAVYDEGEHRIIYKLEFYEGFVVHVLGASPA